MSEKGLFNQLKYKNMIEEIEKETITQLRQMKLGDELRVKYSQTNLNNTRRLIHELNKINYVDDKKARYSVTALTKRLGHITIYRVE